MPLAEDRHAELAGARHVKNPGSSFFDYLGDRLGVAGVFIDEGFDQPQVTMNEGMASTVVSCREPSTVDIRP
ncbi:MAG: hypothetical protein R3F54_27550 [Alphaproteobacteria bacterium]